MTLSLLKAGLGAFTLAAALHAVPRDVSFTQPAASIDAYDYVEITANISGPDARNPFTDAALKGSFTKAGGSPVAVEGFCDSADGGLFRIRFMPSSPGDYSYNIAWRQGDFEKTQTGKFRATDGHRRGPIRVDPKYPWHFIWEGTGEHYYYNSTTAFFLMGFKEEHTIQYTIQRLHDLKINRMRVLLAGNADIFWGDAVMLGDGFSYALRPWIAERPESFDNPGIDYSRFNIAYWQKFERLLRFARERDMIISVVQDISTHKAQPAAGSEDEHRYLKYAAVRLGAFANVTWDLGDDLDSFRDEKWAHETGTLLQGWDIYHHLATSHPVHRANQDRGSAWFGFTSIQDWSRKQHELMLEERQIQLKTGRIIPQSNEEYGYEDHYPHWAPRPPGDSSDTLRRVAWDIAMTGSYGAAGESARRGTNVWPNTGGGWINGRGDDTMVMLKGYAHILEFFTSFEWWKAEPHDELVDKGAYCYAKPGEVYAVYLPEEGKVTVKLEPGRYRAKWFSATTGEFVPIADAIQGGTWTSPKTPFWEDSALLIVSEPRP